MDQIMEGTFLKDKISFWAMSDDDLIEFLKVDLQITRWDKAIIEGVPEDKFDILNKWIEKNKGKIEGVEVSIIPTLTGLTVEEEQLFENEYSSMLAVDRTKLIKNKIERIQINLATEYIAGSEPQREHAQLRWWEQMLQKAQEQNMANKYRLIREKKATKISTKTAKKYKKASKQLKEIDKELKVAQPLLEKHSHIGKGPRKHNSLLNTFINNFDKEFSKNRKEVPTAKALALEMKKAITNNLGKYSFVIEVEDGNDCIKWRDDKGNIQSSPWGDPMRCRITRVRKGRNNK